MTFELLALDDLDAALIASWAVLAARAAEPNPFFEPEFLLPALANLDPGGEVRLLVMRDGAHLTFLSPVVRQRRFKGLPLDTLVGWRHAHCFLGTPLVSADALETAARALLGPAGPRALGASLVALSWAATEGPVVQALVAAQGRVDPLVLDSFERPILRRRAVADCEGSLGRETGRRLAQRGRALARDIGEVKVVDRACDPTATGRFLMLEASGWKGKEGTAIASDPAHASFFCDVMARFAAMNRLELRSLETADGTSLAMSVRFVAGDGAFCFKIAFDEQLRKYAPGLQLEVATLAEFYAHEQQQWVDACTAPGNEFFEALFTDRRQIANVLVPVGGAWTTRLVGRLPALRRWRARVRGGA